MELDWNPSARSGHVARRWRLDMDLSQPRAFFDASCEERKKEEEILGLSSIRLKANTLQPGANL